MNKCFERLEFTYILYLMKNNSIFVSYTYKKDVLPPPL